LQKIFVMCHEPNCAVRLLLLMVFVAAASPALGRFERVDVERIPVARLIENLEKIAKDDPTSVEALLNLSPTR